MVNEMENSKINEIYILYYCIDYYTIKWKRYKILVLLDTLQKYNEDKYNEEVEKFDVYFLKSKVKVYDSAYDDFKQLVYEYVIDAKVGHAEFRKQFATWLKRQNG
jgi:hypothetical protein